MQPDTYLAAFKLASGIAPHNLQNFLLTMIFIAISFWAIVMLYLEIRGLRSGQVDVQDVVLMFIRILIIMMLVVFLISV